MKRDMIVYTAAAWWRDCDAHTRIVGLTEDAVTSRIKVAIRWRAEASVDSVAIGDPCPECEVPTTETDDHQGCAEDAQAWSGVLPESLREVLANETNRDEIISDLRSQGWASLETTF